MTIIFKQKLIAKTVTAVVSAAGLVGMSTMKNVGDGGDGIGEGVKPL